MPLKILGSSKEFSNSLKKAKPEIYKAVNESLKKLVMFESIESAMKSSLRLHPVNGVWKIDVLKKTWQISLQRENDGFYLLRLETHKTMNRLYNNKK